MKKMDFRGLGVALVTPFTRDGSVDWNAFEDFIKFQLSGGVDYLVVLGTTSEAATLTDQEQAKVINTVIDINKGKVPVVVGCGGNNTAKVAAQAKIYSKVEGIDALLSVAPYYNKPGQEGIYAHFKAIAEASDLPIILYNVPGRTSSFIEAKTAIRLASDFENIVALKEASADFAHIMDLIQNKPDNFQILSGDDATSLPGISLGMDGVISVIGNAFPEQFGNLVRKALNGDFETAKDYQYQLLDVFNTLFIEGNPAGVKSYLKHLGMMESTVRLPLTSVSDELNERIRIITTNIN